MALKHLHAVELPTPFPVGPITVYLADAPGEPLTLVDTGPLTREARHILETGLDHLGHAVADLACIIITHAHADHYGLAADLVAASGARVVSHPGNAIALQDRDSDRERRSKFYTALMRQAGAPEEIALAIDRATQEVRRFGKPVAVDVPVDEGDIIHFAGCEWQVLHTPGHANGLICLYEPLSRTLLSSDHLLASISSNPVVEPPPPGHTARRQSLVLYRASLQRIGAMAIERALPSHGPPIDDVSGLVERRLDFHRQRLARVIAILHGGAHTTWEIACALFPNRSPLDTFLAVSEVLGHLDVLALEGAVVSEDQGDVAVWRLAGA